MEQTMKTILRTLAVLLTMVPADAMKALLTAVALADAGCEQQPRSYAN
jgi:hypothetical protein